MSCLVFGFFLSANIYISLEHTTLLADRLAIGVITSPANQNAHITGKAWDRD